jgi:hypothetical protein
VTVVRGSFPLYFLLNIMMRNSPVYSIKKPNEWNLSTAKEGSSKKEGSRIEKKKEVKAQLKSSMF